MTEKQNLPKFGMMEAQLQLAFAHHQAGRRVEAEELCQRMLEAEPRNAGALQLLGLMAQQQGRLEIALKLMRMAVGADPHVADYRNSLGTVLADFKRFDEALTQFDVAVKLRPGYAEAFRNRGIALARAGRLAEAVAPLREAARLRPDDVRAWEDLASLHHQLGDLPAMIECRRRIVALRPDDPAALGELLVTLHYSPDYSPGQILEEHLEWGRRFETLVTLASSRVRDDAKKGARRLSGGDQPLRIGYVSGDFREHPAARFVLPVLRAHDRSRVRVVCYSDVGRPLASRGVTRPDAETEKFRAAADVWHDSSRWSDQQLAQVVRADEIDVLVDLAGHLDSRRLTAFALRPAPVQVAYFGYPGTTGSSCIGYRITDAWQDPPGETEAFHSEALIRIPRGCWCYDAADDNPTPITELPARLHGHVTFAVFNRSIKVTPAMARLWQQVLHRVPGSRLAILASPGEGSVQAATDLLLRYGIDASRVFALPRRSRQEYLKLYGQVDIALDTHPYAGMTTTCDALWMGVPTVTLAGKSSVSRTGVSLLNAAGVPEFVAETPAGYVDMAASLAGDLEKLAAIRRTLRGRLNCSPLADAGRVAAALEAAYHALNLIGC